MSRTAPRAFFSICEFNPYSRTTGEQYGSLRVLENSSLNVTAELIALQGGCQKFDWANAVGSMTAELSLSFSEFPDFVFELFGGNAPTLNAAEATGSITMAANKKGTLIEASTGVASVTIKAGDESDLKFGKYLIKAASATTVDLYLLTGGLDLGRGTNGDFLTDAGKVVAGITVSDTSGTTDIVDFGITITGGSGTVAMTTGDTATFEVRPPNTKSMDVVIGRQVDQSFPEFGAILTGAKKDGELVEVDAYRCKAGGLPLGFARNAFSTAEVAVKMMYDDAQDGVYSVRHVNPTTL